MAFAYVHTNESCTTFCINEMWWLKVAAQRFLINISAASEARRPLAPVREVK